MTKTNKFAAATFALGLALAACGSSGGEDGDAAADGIAEQDDTASADDGSAQVIEEAPATIPAAGSSPAARPPLDPSCDSLVESDQQVQSFDGPQPFCLDADVNYSATVTTNAGTITIDLDQTAAPITVNNFVGLARNNYFDSTVCHRIIQEFVVQCGDPTATGTGGPGYSFPDELPQEGQYQVGSIAMANSGPNTNGSQFFIITGANGAGLPPLYSLFGQVGPAELGVVSEMNARGSLDSGGIPNEELRIESVEITES